MNARFTPIEKSLERGVSMSAGKSVSVWYLEDERNRIEQAAALAGYRTCRTFATGRLTAAILMEGSRSGSIGRSSQSAWKRLSEVCNQCRR